MKKVLIYTKPTCPYCSRAKALLAQKNIDFKEIDITDAPEKRDVMIHHANGRYTVPQIFIRGTHVGGCDDLYALEEAGKLDDLLKD